MLLPNSSMARYGALHPALGPSMVGSYWIVLWAKVDRMHQQISTCDCWCPHLLLSLWFIKNWNLKRQHATEYVSFSRTILSTALVIILPCLLPCNFHQQNAALITIIVLLFQDSLDIILGASVEHPSWPRALVGGSTCTVHRQHTLLLQQVHPEHPDFYPLPKWPLKRANAFTTKIV